MTAIRALSRKIRSSSHPTPKATRVRLTMRLPKPLVGGAARQAMSKPAKKPRRALVRLAKHGPQQRHQHKEVGLGAMEPHCVCPGALDQRRQKKSQRTDQAAAERGVHGRT